MLEHCFEVVLLKLMFPDVKSTFNPVVGCSHRCYYCYARKLAETRLSHLDRYKNFDEPTLVRQIFDRVHKIKNSLVFVCSMGDLFCDEVSDTWIILTIHATKKMVDCKRLFSTKNPIRYLDFLDLFSVDKDILSVTIETNLDYSSFPDYPISEAPSPIARLYAAKHIRKKWTGKLGINIEPVLKFNKMFARQLRVIKPDFVHIGYDNHNFKLPEPTRESVEMLINQLSEFTEVKKKTIRNAWYE